MSGRVFCIVLDACDREAVKVWAHQGQLPTFRKLLDQATFCDVKNEVFGLESSTVFPSFFYGTWPGVHGKAHDELFDPETYVFRGYENPDYSRLALWSLLAQSGKRAFVIDAPYLPLPREPGVTAIMNWGSHTPIPGTPNIGVVTNPPELAEEVTELFGTDPLGGRTCDYLRPRTASQLAWFRDALIERIRQRTKMVEHYAQTRDWDFFMPVYSECHCIGHHAWHLHDPQHDEHEPDVVAEIGDPVLPVYQAIDASIGQLLDKWRGRAECVVYLTHGMEAGYTGNKLLDRILYRLERGGENAVSHAARQSLRRAGKKIWYNTPVPVRSVLAPIHQYARQKVYNEGFQPDRKNRKYFEVYATGRSGGIRINVAGRERSGIVQPGEEYDNICRQLAADLSEIINLDTGEPLVQEVNFLRARMAGERKDYLPDATVIWNRTHPIHTAFSPKIGVVKHPHLTPRSGDHRPEGMCFFVNGDQPGRRLNSDCTVIDVTKTLAAFVGFDHPHLEGETVADLPVDVSRQLSG